MDYHHRSKLSLRKIEAPSQELAKELSAHLQEKRIRGSLYDGAGKTLEFPDDLNLTQWLAVVSTIEKWAREKQIEVDYSVRLQPTSRNTPAEAADTAKLETEAKKRVGELSPEKAEARYNYLSSKPLTELTDEEFQERLLLAQSTPAKTKDRK
jgi:hypothetical protein